MDIAKLAKDINETAHEKGWYDSGPRNFHEVVALMHSELSEALEEWRAGHALTETYIKDGKPEGVPIELADAYIRALDTCYELGLPVTSSLRADTQTNKMRPEGQALSFAVDIADLHYHLSTAIAGLDFCAIRPDPGGEHDLGEVVLAIELVCAKWGIDLEAAVRTKCEFNKTREYRHGNKKA